MNAVSCTNPGYTRRCAPAKPNGTALIRFRSNHSSGLLFASSLTRVGLIRVSSGPAIKRHAGRLRGMIVGGHQRDGGQRGHSRLTHRQQMRAGPDRSP